MDSTRERSTSALSAASSVEASALPSARFAVSDAGSALPTARSSPEKRPPLTPTTPGGGSSRSLRARSKSGEGGSATDLERLRAREVEQRRLEQAEVIGLLRQQGWKKDDAITQLQQEKGRKERLYEEELRLLHEEAATSEAAAAHANEMLQLEVVRLTEEARAQRHALRHANDALGERWAAEAALARVETKASEGREEMQRRVLGHQAKLEAEFRRSLQAMRTEYRREAFDELGAESREALQEYRKLREASEEQLGRIGDLATRQERTKAELGRTRRELELSQRAAQMHAGKGAQLRREVAAQQAATAAAEAEAAAARERAAQAERLQAELEIERRSRADLHAQHVELRREGRRWRTQALLWRRAGLGLGTDPSGRPATADPLAAPPPAGAAADDAEPEEVWWPIRRPGTAAPLLMSKLSSPAAGSAVALARARTAPVVAPAEDAAVQDAGGGVAATPDAAAAREGGAAFEVEQLLDRVATEGDDDEKWAALSASFDAVWRRADAGSGPGGPLPRATTGPALAAAAPPAAAAPARPGPCLFGSPSAPSLATVSVATVGSFGRRPATRGGVGVGVPRPGSGGARPRSAAPRVAGGGWKVHPASKGGGRFASKIDRGRYFVPGEFHREGSAIWHVQEPRLTRPSTALPRKA